MRIYDYVQSIVFEGMYLMLSFLILINISLIFFKDVPLLQAAQFYCVTILSIMRLLVCSSVAQAMTDAS